MEAVVGTISNFVTFTPKAGLVATATDTAKKTLLAMAVQGESFIARRTESLDAEKIASLVTRHTETVFGRTDVEDIM